MSERYARLFTLPEDLYAAGSPVLIAAGALLKDNQTGRVVAQLKLRSFSHKRIIAVKVRLELFDTAGNPLGVTEEYDYLDLNAIRNEEFGQKTPVPVSDNRARSYKPSVVQVVFADQTVWTGSDSAWEHLSRPVILPFSEDEELLRQYQMRFGRRARYVAKREMDLWRCSCGMLNREGESCHSCGNALYDFQTLDLAKLTAEKNSRLQAAAEKAAEEQAAAEAMRKKVGKILKIAIPSVCAILAAVVLLNVLIIPSVKYGDACSLMEEGKYAEAIAAFESIDGYKDSVRKIEECEIAISDERYNAAVSLMEEGRHEEAIAIYETLGDYKDSVQKKEYCEIAARVSGEKLSYEIYNEFADIDLTVYDWTKEDLENGKTRFYLDYEVNPGMHAVAMVNWGVHQEPEYYYEWETATSGSREIFVFEIETSLLKLYDGLSVFIGVMFYAENTGEYCTVFFEEGTQPGHTADGAQLGYITNGVPTGKESEPTYSTEGNIVVHSLTKQMLDNGCIRFTLDCTVPKNRYISFFDPPNGDTFAYIIEELTTGERQTYIFDVKQEEVKKVSHITLNFYSEERNDWLFITGPF